MTENIITYTAVALLEIGSLLAVISIGKLIRLGICSLVGLNVTLDTVLAVSLAASSAMLLLKCGLMLCPGFGWLVKLSLAVFAVVCGVSRLRRKNESKEYPCNRTDNAEQ